MTDASQAAKTLAFILEDEGAEFNVSGSEPGGASKYGVSVVALSDWNKKHGKPPATIADVGNMTQDLAGQIYTDDFLDAIRFDDLPAGIGYRLADASISLGVTGACLILQMSLQMYPCTGIMDEATLAAVKKADPKIVIAALDAAWLAWKHGMSPDGWVKYNHGWINRVIRVRDRALAMA